MGDKPKISIIVCTRDRASQLEKALEYWKVIQPQNLCELILVDNGSSDSTATVIDTFSKQVEFPVVYIYEGKPGLSRARNAGLAHVRGDAVTFTDDDCYPKDDFISEISRLFHEREDIGFLGGRVLLHDKEDLRVTIQERDCVNETRPRSFVTAGAIHGANLSVRRVVIEKIKGFDERLGAGTKLMSAEDTEFMARASWNGFTGMYHPAPVVFHHHGRKNEADRVKLRKGYAIGRGAYYIKFVLRSDSSLKYSKFWLNRFSKGINKQRLYEIRGALTMLFLMLLRRSN